MKNLSSVSNNKDVATKEYVDLRELSSNKVTSVSVSSTDTQYPSAKCLYDLANGKQEALVSGTNIKTINNNSILGNGNVSVGTITEIKMNGASKGTSGIVDLGTVITSHQNISGKQDKPTTLWSGTSTSGNLTLSSSVGNYAYIDIQCRSRTNVYTTTRIYDPSSKTVGLTTGNGEGSTGFYIYNTTELTFSGTTVTRANDRYVVLHNGASPEVQTNTSFYSVTITKIVGYK